jgi:protein SCO1
MFTGTRSNTKYNTKYNTGVIKMTIIIWLIAVSLAFQNIYGQSVLMDEPVIGVVEKLGEIIPGDIGVIDEKGDTITLEQIIDKPTVISLVYFRCPGICSPLMEGIAEVIDRSDMLLGEDYQVLTISFDVSETTDLAVSKKNNHLTLMSTTEAEKHWKFFTSDSVSIAKLTDATGFKYKRTGNDFIHSATLIVVSPERVISRYLNGTYFLPFEVRMAVIEASEGRTGSTVNKILQFCYTYDSTGQTYALNITRVVGSMILFLSVILLLGLIIKPISRKQIS